MRRQLVLVVALALVCAMLLGGERRAVIAQDASPGAMTSLSITLNAVDFAFEGPSEVPAGLVSITMTNNGAEPHHAQLIKLNEGVTPDQFQAALQSGDDAALFPLISFAGGPGTADPGASSTVILRLDAGAYVALCFVSGDDGIPHLAKGMVFPFTVTGTDAGEADPTAAGEVSLLDYSFELPASIAAGPQVWKVTNNGQEPHEIALVKLAPGMTADDFMAMVSGPPATPEGEMAGMEMATPGSEAAGPPFSSAGGMQALASGMSGWVVLDLEPGEYVAICFVPNAEGVPHVALGMVQGFTVQ